MAGLALGAGALGDLTQAPGITAACGEPGSPLLPGRGKKMGGQAGTAPPSGREGSFSTDNAFPGSPRGRGGGAPTSPWAPGGGVPASPWAPGGGRGSGLTLGPLLTLRLTPHRADLPVPGSQAQGSRLQACLTRSGQRWGEGGGPARKRCPARQPLVSTPWLPATGPGTPPREGCPRRPGHCWGSAPRGSGCSPPYTGSRAACPP